MTAIERAARELVRQEYYANGHQPSQAVEAYAEQEWREKVPLLRTVLTAIRDPTDNMMEAGYSELLCQNGSGDIFRAMIDAMLEEG